MTESVNCVLLVDEDNATDFFNERVVTRHNGFKKVNKVYSGLEALEYLKKASASLDLKPDLIFLDINMPAMNGWEFLSEFEKLDKTITEDIKVILLSTSSSPEDVYKSMENHKVNDFINKPLSPDLLDRVLENHFRN